MFEREKTDNIVSVIKNDVKYDLEPGIYRDVYVSVGSKGEEIEWIKDMSDDWILVKDLLRDNIIEYWRKKNSYRAKR